MLVEIRCDKFRRNGAPRGPIVLRPGLNAVVGDGSKKANSIGKSTFLMVVDFCFGGLDYVQKEADTQKKLGPHVIQFKFEFGGKPYYFSRSTAKDLYRFVNVCDENYNTLRTISLERFNEGLKKLYGLSGVDLSFRMIVGRFFRIYNRNTHNELRPLNTVARESDGSGIVDMLKLYGIYGDIDSYTASYEEAQAKKGTYSNIKKYGIAPMASDDAEVAKNEEEIKSLLAELDQIKRDNELGAADGDDIRAARKSALLSEKKRLQRERRKLVARLTAISFDQEFDPEEMTRKYQPLLDFFPGVEIDIERIQKLDAFQKKVRTIVATEAQASNEDTNVLIAAIDARIEELNKALEEYKGSPNIKEEVADRISEIKARIKELEKANQNYAEFQKAKTDFTTESNKRKAAIETKTSSLQRMINESMEALNQNFDGGRNYAPTLHISGFDSYQFFTPNDTGTGSRNKGLWLFDLTVLRQTGLPAFIHDSILFNSVEYERTKVALELFSAEVEKQIFVAIDDPYAGGEVFKDLALNHAVLTLGHDGLALYGEEWNKKGNGEQG